MTVKVKCLTSLVWMGVVFSFLTWILYGVNAYEAVMLKAATGTNGALPSLAHAKELRRQMENSDDVQTRYTLMCQMSDEEQRFWRIQSAGVVKDRLIWRTGLLSGAAAIMPLLLIWFPVFKSSWQNLVLKKNAVTGGIAPH